MINRLFCHVWGWLYMPIYIQKRHYEGHLKIAEHFAMFNKFGRYLITVL